MHMVVNVCGNKSIKSCFYINKNIYIKKLLIIGSTGDIVFNIKIKVWLVITIEVKIPI